MIRDTYSVLAKTSERLREIIVDAFREDDLRVYEIEIGNVTFHNPVEAARSSVSANAKISIWLYRIEENEFVKNDPPKRTEAGTLRFPPLSLDLSFLITPLTKDPLRDLEIMGRIMQTLYDNAVVPLNVDAVDVHEELRIILGRISLEEITRIWDALNDSYRTSICYLVRVNRIASERTLVAGKVRRKQLDYVDRGFLNNKGN